MLSVKYLLALSLEDAKEYSAKIFVRLHSCPEVSVRERAPREEPV